MTTITATPSLAKETKSSTAVGTSRAFSNEGD